MMKKLVFYFACVFTSFACAPQSVLTDKEIIANHLNGEYDFEKTKMYLSSDKLNVQDVLQIYQSGLENSKDTGGREIEQWPFSQEDVEYIKANFKTENKAWRNGDIVSNAMVISSNDELDVNIARDVSKGTAQIFHLSKVLLDKSKTNALFGIRVSSGLNASKLYVAVYSRQGNRWVEVNKVYSTELN